MVVQISRCFVVNCSGNVTNRIAAVSADPKLAPCVHVKAALASSVGAQPLVLRNSVLNSLQVCAVAMGLVMV